MKTKTTTATAALLGATMALFTPVAFGQGNSGNNKKLPVIPVGWIDAYPTIVKTGTHPQVRWGINLPSQVPDVVDIVDGGTIVSKEPVCIECRMLGNGVTVHYSDGSWQYVNAEAQISLNGGAYQPVFYGNNNAINPNTIVWTVDELQKNQTVRFGGRYNWKDSWGPTYRSNDGTKNVRLLVNGETPPTVQPMHGAPSLEDFVRPYLDPNGRVNIGPMDVIVFMELTHTDSQQNHQGYDLQDIVMLCTLKPKGKTNNGHGNNDDGVDSSNPGNAPFIYLDTDPNVDDEGSGGGAAPSKKNK